MSRFATLQDSLCGRPSLKQFWGFGLVELMIALALGMVIILGVTTLFSDSSRTLNDITRAGRQLENSLYAMDLLAKELSLVDYWGEANAPVDADDPAYGPLRAGELNGLEISGYPQVPPLCPGTGAPLQRATHEPDGRPRSRGGRRLHELPGQIEESGHGSLRGAVQ